jgi:hypothetical protein
MKIDFINLKTGVLNFVNKVFISAKTTFEEILKMKGTIDCSFENTEMGIQNLSFFNKEIEGDFYNISVHFNFGKLSVIFVIFEDGKQLLETALWSHLKQIKTNKHSKKGDISKRKNFDWGSITHFILQK